MGIEIPFSFPRFCIFKGEGDTGPPRRGRAPTARERPFKLGPLGTLNQVIVALGKTIRTMADGTLDSQVGARICNGLGIMRACLETQKLEQLEARMDEIADRVAHERTGAARERTSTHEVAMEAMSAERLASCARR